MGRGNKAKIFTGIGLSAFVLISLLLPVWTADTFSMNSNYGIDEKITAISPLLLMSGAGLAEMYSWVAGLAVITVLAMVAGAVLNIIFSVKTRNEQTSVAQTIVPGIIMTSGSFVFFVIGIVAVGTYGYNTYAEATFGFPFFVTVGLFITHCLLSRASNKPVGATIVRRTTNTYNPNVYAGGSRPSTYSTTVNHQTTQSSYGAGATTSTSKPTDGRVYGNLTGAQRVLDVYEDRVVLTQIQNLRSIMTHDYFNGTKEIPFAMISSVQYKPASNMILGYIQFEVPGVSVGNNFASENSWTFEASLNILAKEVADYCKQRVIEAHQVKPTQVVQQVSAADEVLKLKQLLDAGIITQEEFDAKKKQLLGL